MERLKLNLRETYRFCYVSSRFFYNAIVGLLVYVYIFFLLIQFLIKIGIKRFNLNEKINPRSAFIGMYNVSGNISRVAKALSENKYDVFTVCYDHVYSYENVNGILLSRKSPYINQFMLAKVFFNIIGDKSIFIFFWSKTFFPLNLDLFLLRILGKRVIVWNCGDDVRYAPIHQKVNQFYKVPFPYVKSLNTLKGNKIFLQRFWFTKICFSAKAKIITSRDSATFLASEGAYTCDFPFDGRLNNLEVINKNSTSNPLIIHAPSVPEEKGTLTLEKVIDSLRAENIKFEYRTLTEVKNQEVLDALKIAEIVVDYPGNTSGTFAIEAMAHKCAIIGANQWEYSGRKKLPIIQFYEDEKDLKNKLLTLISDQGLRCELMKKSLEAWKAHHSHSAFISNFERILNSAAPTLKPKEDYKPLLINCAESTFQRLIIKLFYK